MFQNLCRSLPPVFDLPFLRNEPMPQSWQTSQPQPLPHPSSLPVPQNEPIPAGQPFSLSTFLAGSKERTQKASKGYPRLIQPNKEMNIQPASVNFVAFCKNKNGLWLRASMVHSLFPTSAPPAFAIFHLPSFAPGPWSCRPVVLSSLGPWSVVPWSIFPPPHLRWIWLHFIVGAGWLEFSDHP